MSNVLSVSGRRSSGHRDKRGRSESGPLSAGRFRRRGELFGALERPSETHDVGRNALLFRVRSLRLPTRRGLHDANNSGWTSCLVFGFALSLQRRLRVLELLTLFSLTVASMGDVVGRDLGQGSLAGHGDFGSAAIARLTKDKSSSRGGSCDIWSLSCTCSKMPRTSEFSRDALRQYLRMLYP